MKFKIRYILIILAPEVMFIKSANSLYLAEDATHNYGQIMSHLNPASIKTPSRLFIQALGHSYYPKVL